MPDPPATAPRDPGFRLANWRGQSPLFQRFEDCIAVEIFPDDGPYIRCRKCDCHWWPTFRPDGPRRAPLRGPGGGAWWHCPEGCNTQPGAVPRAWIADIAYVAEQPPWWWRPPAEQVAEMRAASIKRPERAEYQRAPVNKPGRPPEYEAPQVETVLVNLMRRDRCHRQEDVDAEILGLPFVMGNKRNVGRALVRASAAEPHRAEDWEWRAMKRRAREMADRLGPLAANATS